MRILTEKNLLTLATTSGLLALVLKKPTKVPKQTLSSGTTSPQGENKTALVVGLGIAGMSAALGLKKAGWQPMIIERADSRRTGGYFIGLSAEGFEAANYFGIADALVTRTPNNYTTWEVDKNNQRHPGARFTDQPNHPEVVLRGDIEQALWTGIVANEIPVHFSTIPVMIGGNADEAWVKLKNTNTGEVLEQTVGLVIGADGMRSSVRRQAFGSDEEYMKPLGAMICAFLMQAQMPNYAAHDGVIVAEENRSLWFFPFADHPPTALFTYRPDDIDAQFKMPPKQALEQAFAGMSGDGAVAFALAQFDKADNFLFDSVNMVDVPKWVQNRVMLLGDSAWCLTLYSGYGATSAMHGGALLGKLLSIHTTTAAALQEWETQMRPFIQKQRRLVPLKSQIFVPSNRVTFALRSAIVSSGLLFKLRSLSAKRIERRTQLLNAIFGERTKGVKK